LNLQGKGFYIWQILRCENGNANTIAATAQAAGLTHVLIKIADASSPYNIDPITGQDLVPALVQALHARDIVVWGWQYVYGYEPEAEAAIAIQRINALSLDGFAIDAEAQYKLPGMDEAALIYMDRLRSSLPGFPIALSSYRYPTYHPSLPWREFLQDCDINMPQVYWIESDNPGEQLIRSLREFESIQPFRPIIPTGSAFLQGDWQPTPSELFEFLDTAKQLNMSAANFWEWGHTKKYLPELWDVIADYDWEIGPSQDIVERYFEALNAHNVDRLLELYNSDAVHVTSSRTIQGTQMIKEWYSNFFQNTLPNAKFFLGNENNIGATRQFTWTATSTSGNIENGSDSIGLIGNRITYHYMSYKITK